MTNPTGGTEEDAQLSACHKAPVVICEGAVWDVPLGSIREGSTYFYGCTECHKACDLYVALAEEDAIGLTGNLYGIAVLPNTMNEWIDEIYKRKVPIEEAKDVANWLLAEARKDEHDITAAMFVYENAAITYKRLEKRAAQLAALGGKSDE